MDFFPKSKYWKVAGICSLVGFLTGLIYITPGGQWMLNLVDQFGGTFLIFALVILEIVGITWVYGLENICWDMEFMLKRKVSLLWRICWVIVSPAMMIFIFVYSMVKYESPTFMSLPYPTSSLVAGWFIFGIGLAQIIVWGTYITSRKSALLGMKSALKALFKQNPKWGPASPTIRKEWLAFKAEKLAQRKIQATGHSKIKQLACVLIGKYN